MVYRFNRLFNVSKTRAAVVSILCFLGGLAVLVFAIAGADLNFATVTFACWGYALIYGGIWLYKHNRDKKILAEAQVPVPAQVEEPMQRTNPDSSRLFVPERRSDM